jgi:hypothetical protein
MCGSRPRTTNGSRQRRISLNSTPPWLSRSARFHDLHRHDVGGHGEVTTASVISHQGALLVERASLDGLDIDSGICPPSLLAPATIARPQNACHSQGTRSGDPGGWPRAAVF